MAAIDILAIEKICKELLKKINREVFSAGLGNKLSKSHGQGSAFQQFRQYEYGDDVRHIHWALWAKQRQLFIKSFTDERRLHYHVYLNIRETMLLGNRETNKLTMGIVLAALMCLLAKRDRDELTLTLIGDELTTIRHAEGELGLRKLILQLSSLGLVNESGEITNPVREGADRKMKSAKEVMSLLPRPLQCGKNIILSDTYGWSESIFMKAKIPHFFIPLAAPIEEMSSRPFPLVGKEAIIARGPNDRLGVGVGLETGQVKEQKKILCHPNFLPTYVKELAGWLSPG